jgi:hypothetical protein
MYGYRRVNRKTELIRVNVRKKRLECKLKEVGCRTQGIQEQDKSARAKDRRI